MSFSLRTGAENLLTKALRDLSQGKEPDAIRLVERACRLPYDEHEDAAPAAMAAHMLLFDAITEELEEAEEGNSVWLDAALPLLRDIGEQEQVELGHCLLAIRQDYAIEPHEGALIDRAAHLVPDRPELQDQGDLSAEQLTAPVTGVLRAILAYREALALS
jgi:hypothetical protein